MVSAPFSSSLSAQFRLRNTPLRSLVVHKLTDHRILIIEGIPSVILGCVVYFWLSDDPSVAYFLTPAEKDLMLVRKRRQIGHTTSSDLLHKEDVIKAFKDWKIWVFAAAQFGVDTLLYGYSTFLPTIIKGLGTWSTAQVQALTIPCYALGAITYLTVAYFSDRYQQRFLAILPFAIISIIGYGILLADVSSGVHFFGCFLVATGLYVAGKSLHYSHTKLTTLTNEISRNTTRLVAK